MTPNETALEDAKNVLESDIVDNVGDAAVNKPHEKMNEAKSNVIDHEDASKTKTQNPTVFGEFFRTTTSSEGEFDEHHHQSLQAMALRKEVLDKRQGRPNQPAVTDAGPLQQIENVQGENEAAVDAVNGSNNFNPVLKASANQQEQHTTSNIEKVLQLKQSIDSIVRSSKASHGANIVAFPELVRPELGAPAATKTAEYPELPQTDGRSEVSTGAATKPTGYPETSPQPVSRNLFVSVLYFNTPSISLGRITFFLSCTIHNCFPVGDPHPRHTISQHRHCYRVRGSQFQGNRFGG